MSQALKIIQFDTDEKNENKTRVRSKKIFNSVVKPLNYAATITAVLGVISLVLEIKLFFQFSYELYLARLIPTIFSFLTLIFLKIKFVRKHQVALLHFYLFPIILSFGFFAYRVPQSYAYNLMGALLLVLVLSQFVSWKPINQIFVVLYFSASFLTAAIISGVFQINNFNSWFYGVGILSLLLISVLPVYLKANTIVITRRSLKNSKDENNEESDDNEVYQEFLDRSIQPLFQLTFDGNIKYANNSFNEILGNLTEEELKNFNFFEHFVKNDKIKSHILKKLENKGRVENYRLTIQGNNGIEDVYLMDCKVDNSFDENQLIEGSIKNITQIHNKEKELVQEISNKISVKKSSSTVVPNISSENNKKQNLISKLSHELRTPMNSVLGFLTLIENGLFETEEELKEFSRSAKLSAESLLNLLNDILELSKIDDGSVDILETDFDLRLEIEKVITAVSPHLEEKNLNLNFSISDDVPQKIISDPMKYSQILMNLISNAIDVTENGEIKVLVSSKYQGNNKVEILTFVEDSSKGMESSKLNEMLNVDLINDKTKPKVTTPLLRLIICKQLVNLLGGKLLAKSEVEKGSRFVFSIFYKDNSEHETIINEDGKEVKVSKTSSRSRLLLVEDNPISRKVEKKLLEDAGYLVDCVDNGSDAIEKISSGLYNLVLMDIELKDLNGLETTKKIRELSEDVNSIPIIAVTAHSSMKDREKCLLAGMNDYISKPINITFLKMTIDQWLNDARSM